jgi:GNAT superfamily N-acetyltransferase
VVCDEVVVRAIELFDHGLEARHIAVAQLPRGQAFLDRGLLHFLAVLVGAGEEIDFVAVEPHKARNGVGRDRLIGVADMRRAVRIGDRGGDVESGFVGHFRLNLKHKNAGKAGLDESGG